MRTGAQYLQKIGLRARKKRPAGSFLAPDPSPARCFLTEKSNLHTSGEIKSLFYKHEPARFGKFRIVRPICRGEIGRDSDRRENI